VVHNTCSAQRVGIPKTRKVSGMYNSHFCQFCWKWTILVFTILCMTLAGCWFHASTPMGPVSKASSSSTGTLGKYKFASLKGVKTFNSEIGSWFSKKGYVPYSQRSFDAITGMDEWKIEGLLLCRQIDIDNQFFVFIPQCKHPEENIQIIGFHTKLKGTAEEVKQRRDDFEAENKEFQKSFPST
jgi:hypothetical protein